MLLYSRDTIGWTDRKHSQDICSRIRSRLFPYSVIDNQLKVLQLLWQLNGSKDSKIPAPTPMIFRRRTSSTLRLEMIGVEETWVTESILMI